MYGLAPEVLSYSDRVTAPNDGSGSSPGARQLAEYGQSADKLCYGSAAGRSPACRRAKGGF